MNKPTTDIAADLNMAGMLPDESQYDHEGQELIRAAVQECQEIWNFYADVVYENLDDTWDEREAWQEAHDLAHYELKDRMWDLDEELMDLRWETLHG
jgi:hypothetical protein